MAPKPRAQRGQSFLPLRRNESSTISSLRSLDKPPTADRCRTERKACAQSPKRKTRPDERKRIRAPLLQIPSGDPGGRESSPAASTEVPRRRARVPLVRALSVRLTWERTPDVARDSGERSLPRTGDSCRGERWLRV